MHAKVGDQLVVEGHRADEPRRVGKVIEVRGEGGGPPYLVRWADGHEGLAWPGSDAHVEAGETTDG